MQRLAADRPTAQAPPSEKLVLHGRPTFDAHKRAVEAAAGALQGPSSSPRARPPLLAAPVITLPSGTCMQNTGSGAADIMSVPTAAGGSAAASSPPLPQGPWKADRMLGFIGLSMWLGTTVRVWSALANIERLQCCLGMLVSEYGQALGSAPCARVAWGSAASWCATRSSAWQLSSARAILCCSRAPSLCQPSCAVYLVSVAWPSYGLRSYLQWRVPALAFLRVFLFALPFNFSTQARHSV